MKQQRVNQNVSRKLSFCSEFDKLGIFEHQLNKRLSAKEGDTVNF